MTTRARAGPPDRHDDARTPAERWALALAAPRLWRWRLDHMGGLAADARKSVDVRAAREKARAMMSSASATKDDAGAILARFETALARASAYDTAGGIALVGWAAWLNVITFDDAWALALRAARETQPRFASWAAYGAAYVERERGISDDRSDPSSVIAGLLAPGGHWATLGWDTRL